MSCDVSQSTSCYLDDQSVYICDPTYKECWLPTSQEYPEVGGEIKNPTANSLFSAFKTSLKKAVVNANIVGSVSEDLTHIYESDFNTFLLVIDNLNDSKLNDALRVLKTNKNFVYFANNLSLYSSLVQQIANGDFGDGKVITHPVLKPTYTRKTDYTNVIKVASYSIIGILVTTLGYSLLTRQRQ